MFKIFVIFSVLCLSAYAQDKTFCDIDTIKEDPDAPNNPLPSIADDLIYECDIEDNNEFAKTTAEVKEYYDGTANMARSRTVEGGLTLNNYVYPARNQFLSVIQTECTVNTLNSNSLQETNFMIVKGKDGKDKVVGGSFGILDAMKRQNPAFKVKYIGKSEVRGIPVRQWQACSFDGTSTSKITVSYSALNWITAENKGSIPIETQISKKGKTSTSNKIYSIIRYRELTAIAEEKFYTESGVYCAGRDFGDRKMPQVAEVFSFTSQFSHPKPLSFELFGDVKNTRNEFDNKRNLFARSYYQNDHRMKAVHDWTTGLQYTADRNTGECQIVKLNKNDSHLIDAFKFENGPSYQWTGQRRVRGINTDVWISQREFNGQKATYEWYFTTDLWQDQEAQSTAKNVPVLLIISAGADGPLAPPKDKYYFHLFNWETTRSDLFDFDVSHCQANVESKNVRFEIRPNSEEYTYMVILQQQFKTALTNKILETTGLSVVRLGHMDAVFANQTVFVTFSLFDRPSFYGYEGVSEISLTDAEEKLQSSIKAETFAVNFMNYNIKVDKNSYILLDKSRGRYVYDTYETGKTINYSLGSVIAFLVVFALVGVGAGFVLGYFLIIKRQGALPELPGPLGFLNPGYSSQA